MNSRLAEGLLVLGIIGIAVVVCLPLIVEALIGLTDTFRQIAP